MKHLTDEQTEQPDKAASPADAMRAALAGVSFAGCVFDGRGSSNVLPALANVTNSQILLAASQLGRAAFGAGYDPWPEEAAAVAEGLSFCGVMFAENGSAEGRVVAKDVTNNQVELAAEYLRIVGERSLNDAWTQQQMQQARNASEMARVMNAMGLKLQ